MRVQPGLPQVRVAAGEKIIIARAGKPTAKLVPLSPMKKTRGYGLLKGEFTLPDSFFEPLPEEELAAWEGRSMCQSLPEEEPAPREGRDE